MKRKKIYFLDLILIMMDIVHFSDDLTLLIANFLRENPWVMKLGSITIGVLVIVSVASKLRRKSEIPTKKEK